MNPTAFYHSFCIMRSAAACIHLVGAETADNEICLIFWKEKNVGKDMKDERSGER